LRQAEDGHRKTLPVAMKTLRRHLKPWLDLPARQFAKADAAKGTRCALKR